MRSEASEGINMFALFTFAVVEPVASCLVSLQLGFTLVLKT